MVKYNLQINSIEEFIEEIINDIERFTGYINVPWPTSRNLKKIKVIYQASWAGSEN